MQFKAIVAGSLAVYTVAANPAPAPTGALNNLAERQETDPIASIKSVFENVYGISSFPTNTATLLSVAQELLSAAVAQATDSGVQSAYSALQTAVPSSVFESIQLSGVAPFTATDAPQWFSSLDSDLQSNILSQQSVARSLVTSALQITDAGSGAGAATATGSSTKETGSSGSSGSSGSGSSASNNWAPRATAQYAMGVIAAVGVGAVAML